MDRDTAVRDRESRARDRDAPVFDYDSEEDQSRSMRRHGRRSRAPSYSPSSSLSRSPSARPPRSKSRRRQDDRDPGSRPRSRRPSRSPSMSRSRSRSRSRSHSRSHSRSRNSSRTTANTSQQSKSGGSTAADFIKGSAGIIAGIGIASVVAHKFWPKGVLYGEKEEWERVVPPKHRQDGRRMLDRAQSMRAGTGSGREDGGNIVYYEETVPIRRRLGGRSESTRYLTASEHEPPMRRGNSFDDGRRPDPRAGRSPDRRLAPPRDERGEMVYYKDAEPRRHIEERALRAPELRRGERSARGFDYEDERRRPSPRRRRDDRPRDDERYPDDDRYYRRQPGGERAPRDDMMYVVERDPPRR